ncbi:MAG: ATP synthase F0 subunit B [Bacteroidetes bacterium CG2_30_32_10]|nr:MAG: ATP synthase F0 subunit B [Bacteroidetes bacterium CG2_30_32_10]
MELVTPNIGLVFWMTLAFGILLFILGKFAWKPIMKMIKERENTIEEALQTAEKTKLEMANLQLSNEKLLKEAKEEREALLREARKIKDGIVLEAKHKATDEANKIIESARLSIQNDKMAAITELKNQIASLSIEIAEKILNAELADKDKQNLLINKFLDEVKLN